MNDISSLRSEYKQKELLEKDLTATPYQQFHLWLIEAISAKVNEPTAMNVCTVSLNHKPSSRILLLKDYDEEGFVFFTNYNSRKGIELQNNTNCALTFFWPELERQVRVEGNVEKTSEEISDQYFQSRPNGSQIGALVSSQSETIINREYLENLRKEVEMKYNGKVIPRPYHWGGYKLIPETVEFWQGRPNRLHDRIVFSRSDASWTINRLAP